MPSLDLQIMHVIRVIIEVKESALAEFRDIARREFEEVPKRFDGCVRFGYWFSATDPNAVLLYEEWESAEAFAAYRSSGYFEELGSKLFPLLAGKPDSAYYDAEKVGP